ncbi:hypothetical protein FG379_000017 [Cryptosporidium bovis]|uniref:uncharacterized protein n=1 Tax=Cryptosporidium bovis TaxID=310047 RepID=UPI003519FFD0|nr:hypothetical protein FG379_000017 [Cryptosporidium bovis]
MMLEVGSNNALDRTLEAELKNPRVIGCSVIIKDNRPVYDNVYTSSRILKNISVPPLPATPLMTSGFARSGYESSKNSPNFASNSKQNKSSYEIDSKNSDVSLENKNNYFNLGKIIKNENKSSSKNNNKKDFSIWRCLCWPEIAVNPIYSSGYGKMRLSLCLNKIIPALFLDKTESVDKDIIGVNDFELLPYIRIYYNDELLFQSCVINKNMCIILDIDVHHPLSNITLEIYDFDDSDPSLIGNLEDCITQIIIPIGAHSNRKPLETQLLVGFDEETRLLFIRKSHQNKVQKDNLLAQKLLRFPIANLYDYDAIGSDKNTKGVVNKYSESNNIIEYGEIEIDDEFQILDASFDSNERNEQRLISSLPNGIYHEISSKMVKNAVELSKSAENKYKATGRLQNPYCTLVAQIYSEIKWTRFSLIPREIFALYLPEPKNTTPRSSSTRDLRFENNIRTLVNTVIVLRELFSSDCFLPIKDKVWKLHNWESYTLSLFAFSVIWYTLFHPEYIYSLIFSLSFYILVRNFNKKNKFTKLESSILAKLRPSQLIGSGINLNLDLDFDSSKKNNCNSSQHINRENCTLESEESTADGGGDFEILETLLSSSIFSPNSLYYIKKMSVITEGFTRYTYQLLY